MDLRGKLKAEDIEEAAEVLNYQPFKLTDDLETGAAFSWISGADPRLKPPLLFRRSDLAQDQWAGAVIANESLRAMYEDFLDAVKAYVPDANSLLDIACNNGYFPIGAEIRGMRGFGLDLGQHYKKSVALLNRTFNTNATFIEDRFYDSRTHRFNAPIDTYDVTVMSAIMCHIPDPLDFLAESCRVARRAFLFWGQIIDSQRLFVAYHPPHSSLSNLKDFPFNFNDNTRLSRGLFDLSLKQLGFSRIIEIAPKDTWMPELHSDLGATLDEELRGGSKHIALLAIRDEPLTVTAPSTTSTRRGFWPR